MKRTTVNTARRPVRQRGLTLIELLISLAVGLLIVAAFSLLFSNSARTRRELLVSADVIENGRFAIDALSRELATTGFYGSLVQPVGGTANTGAAMCARTTANLPAWRDSLPSYVAGLRSAAGANVDADPSCVARKAGSDAIFVQRASTCAIGEADCPAESANEAYIQVSECGSEYSAKPVVVDQGTAGSFTLQTKACLSTAHPPKRRLVRRIYFIDTANALVFQDVPLAGAMPAPVVIAENIEQMQLEYAVDGNADGTPDSFTASPGAADWPNVIGVRIWLLSRSDTSSRNNTAATDYVLGGDTTVSIAAAAAGNPKRRVYSTYVTFITPKSRRES